MATARRRRRLVVLVALLLLGAVLLGTGGSRPGQQPPQDSVPASTSGPEVATVLPLRARVTSAPVLVPGAEHPLDVLVENPNAWGVAVTGIGVTVDDVRSPRASATLPCGRDDFATHAGTFDALEVPGGAAVSLSQAQVPRQEWPRVAMVDSDVNQDGCQGGNLTLGFTITGTPQ